MMKEKKPDIFMAGDAIYAGIDEEDAQEYPLCVVVQFQSKEQLKAAMQTGNIRCTVFGDDREADA